MSDWRLEEFEFSDGSDAAALLRQAAEWMDDNAGAFYVVGINWSEHEWTGHGGSDDVLRIYVRVQP